MSTNIAHIKGKISKSGYKRTKNYKVYHGHRVKQLVDSMNNGSFRTETQWSALREDLKMKDII